MESETLEAIVQLVEKLKVLSFHFLDLESELPGICTCFLLLLITLDKYGVVKLELNNQVSGICNCFLLLLITLDD